MKQKIRTASRPTNKNGEAASAVLASVSAVSVPRLPPGSIEAAASSSWTLTESLERDQRELDRHAHTHTDDAHTDTHTHAPQNPTHTHRPMRSPSTTPRRLLLLRAAALLLVSAASMLVAQAQKNVEITRTVDLSMAVVRAQTDIRATGVQGGRYVVSFPEALAPNLAFMQVVDADSEAELPAKRVKDA
jgi:hypothetical protein